MLQRPNSFLHNWNNFAYKPVHELKLANFKHPFLNTVSSKLTKRFQWSHCSAEVFFSGCSSLCDWLLFTWWLWRFTIGSFFFLHLRWQGRVDFVYQTQIIPIQILMLVLFIRMKHMGKARVVRIRRYLGREFLNLGRGRSLDAFWSETFLVKYKLLCLYSKA